MKVALITDTHAGARNDSEVFADYQDKFYTETFFPTLKERGIKTIFHLGDFFERRKFSNHETLFRIKKCFLEPLVENDIEMHLLIGNHDVAHKNSNKVNGADLFLTQFKSHITFYTEPTSVAFPDRTVHFIPWINSENYNEAKEFIDKSVPSLMLGHFDIAGFKMHQEGNPSDHGLPMDWFRSQELVLSGHFHTQSKISNVHYIGNPFELTWSDFKDPRGFWIIDLETLEMEFIQNPDRMFFKIVYDDTKDVDYLKMDFSKLRNKFLKVIVKSKKDPYKFDLFAERVYNNNPFEVQIIEASSVANSEMSEEELEQNAKSTDQIIKSYCDSMMNVDDDVKQKVRELLVSIYLEAISEA